MPPKIILIAVSIPWTLKKNLFVIFVNIFFSGKSERTTLLGTVCRPQQRNTASKASIERTCITLVEVYSNDSAK